MCVKERSVFQSLIATNRGTFGNIELRLSARIFKSWSQAFFCDQIHKQDGRLAPAYFSPNYKYFDQLLQTVKNKTTVLILVFKEFLQTSIRPLISVLYAKGYHDFPLKNFCLTVPKNFVGEPFCFSEKILVPKNVREKRRGGYHDFLSKLFCLTVPKNFVGEPFCVS